MSVSAKLTPATPYRNATSGSDQPPRTGRWWNRTRIPRNSESAPTKVATKSRANESRYWARDLMDAATRCAYVSSVATGSATLHHHPADAGGEDQAAEAQECQRPGGLEGQRADQAEAAVLAQEHVDRHLQHGGERQRLDHGTRPVGEEGERDDRAAQKRPQQGGNVQDAAIVQEPEGAEVDDEADREAYNGCGDHRDGKGEPEDRVGGEAQPEQELGEQERGQAAEEGVVPGPPEVAGQPRALEVERTAQVDDDVAGHDADREVVPSP